MRCAGRGLEGRGGHARPAGAAGPGLGAERGRRAAAGAGRPAPGGPPGGLGRGQRHRGLRPGAGLLPARPGGRRAGRAAAGPAGRRPAPRSAGAGSATWATPSPGSSCRSRRRRAGPATFPPTGSATTTTCSAGTGPPAGGRSRRCGRPGALTRWSAGSSELSRRPHAAPARPRGYSSGSFRLTPSAGEHRVGRPAGDQLHPPRRHLPGQHLPAARGAVRRGSPRRVLRRGHPAGPAVRRVPADAGRGGGEPVAGAVPAPHRDAACGRGRSRAPGPGPRMNSSRGSSVTLLERSAKDRAENVMIVDLMRNDLSRVCVPGSVRVPALLRAEPHPGVWHLVSDVRGTLEAGTRRRAADRGDVPARVGHRRPEGPGAGDHPRARGDAPGGVHRGGRLPQPGGRPGAERRDPHVRVRRRPGVAGQRRRNRRRFLRRR